jgi:hypothetical protein
MAKSQEKPRVLFSTRIAGFDIRLEQIEPHYFRVIYGLQSTVLYDQDDAAKELGRSIMHALQTQGVLIEA